MGYSDKHYNNKHYTFNRELPLLKGRDILDTDIRMINYIVYPYGSTRPPLVISYPNTLPQYTYLWN